MTNSKTPTPRETPFLQITLVFFRCVSPCLSLDDEGSSDETLPPDSPHRSHSSSLGSELAQACPRTCPRTLHIEYWERDDETLQRKWDHQDFVDANYRSREERILLTVLKEDDTVMERNPFPYLTPPRVQHWTLWCVRDMDAKQIQDWVTTWIRANMPQALQWNYDDNESRSIDLFHVHVYIEAREACKRKCDKSTEIQTEDRAAAKRCRPLPPNASCGETLQDC